MLIELKNINKTYMTKTGVTFRALSNVSTTFEDAGMVFILGKSGSGKSTLLNILGALDTYDSGEMWAGGHMTKRLSGKTLDYYRNTTVGFIFQEFNLIDSLTAAENVRLALDVKGGAESKGQSGKRRVQDMLDRLGIGDKAGTKARELSGGQRQRVSIARALIKDPQVILADEPTGSLDSVTGEEIFAILKEIAKTKLVIVVTHDTLTAAKHGDRIIEMKNGEIFRDVRRRKPGESLMASGIDVVGNALVRLNAGAEIDERFTREINGIIAASGRRAYVTVETEENKVKALFPNLRDAVNLSRQAPSDGAKSAPRPEDAAAADYLKTDELLESGAYIPYSGTETPVRHIEFQRSRTSFLGMLKMGVHNLRLKKFRLVMTLIVTILSFTLFGAAHTLSAVQAARSMAKSIRHDGVRAVSVSKNELYSADGSDTLSSAAVEALQAKHKNCRFYEQYFFKESLLAGYNVEQARLAGYYFNSFVGVTEIDDIAHLGFTVQYGTGTPTGARSAVISRYAAEALVKGRAFGAAGGSIENIVGEKFSINNFEVMIVGIYETSYEPYKLENRLLVDSFNHVFQLFVGKDSRFLAAYNRFEAESRYGIGGGDVVLDFAIGGKAAGAYLTNGAATVFEDDPSLAFRLNATVVTEGVQPPPAGSEKEGILLVFPQSSAARADSLREINAFNRTDDAYLIIAKNTGSTGNPYPDNKYPQDQNVKQFAADIFLTLSASDYYIRGYIETPRSHRGVALQRDSFERFLDAQIPLKRLLIGTSQSEGDNYRLIRDLLAQDMQINADFNAVFTVYLAIFKNFESVVLGGAVLLSVLAALLMYNFISTSIRMTKRHIGLLRALGVKKFNSFLVYVLEGLVIALLTFLVAALILSVMIPAINASLSAYIGIYVAILVPTFRVFAFMAILSFFVAILAIFIPWFKFAKISPVDALSDRG
ncbi:MAG: ABC transporter ATP-binding protein/permease [Clostridiales bacterium]|jgi:ABC-type lipoprotein export system ATPase subunit/ABC-type antimicrobial peptide transport system permease subunit|nr:ABC transporter ATP-binding protein/permease [Clostridiales bacterium]